MQPGNLMLWAAIVVTFGSAVAFALSKNSIARKMYIASASIVTAASAYLMYLILGNHFEYEYIALNSSKSLPVYYKISAFWAGQEGSFLLWALFSAVLGLLLIKNSTKLMAFWSVVQSFILGLLLIDSPFLLSKNSSIGDLANAASTGTLTDGLGLREILQNPWMAIHPPVVFLGYAALCIPAAFVVASLLKGDTTNWAKKALPWTVFGWVVMGAGIILGAYWAYEELGWGGYWAWDPVENASLVPWIFATALLHGMISEKYRGSFKRTNVILAFLTFLSVFYATFLTRSNVLVKASVHSFGGASTATPLIWFMLAFTVFAAVVTIFRWRRIEEAPSFTEVASKDYAFFLSMVMFIVSASIILFGTSIPIVGKSVDKSFYNNTNAPISFSILILMALAPVLSWKRRKNDENQLGLGILIAAAAGSVPLICQRLSHSAFFMMAFSIAFAAFSGIASNVFFAVKNRKTGLRALGGFIAHIGIAVFFLGVVLSSSGKPAKSVRLIKDNDPTKVQGYSIAYSGISELKNQTYGIDLTIDSKTKAQPKLQQTREGNVLARPFILQTFARDLYIAPNYIPGTEEKVLKKGDAPIPVQDFTLKFVDFVNNGKSTGAKLEAKVGGTNVKVTPTLAPSGRGESIKIPTLNALIKIDDIMVDDGAVEITFTPNKHNPTSIKLTKGKKIESNGYSFIFKDWFFPAQTHEMSTQLGAKIEIDAGSKHALVEPTYRVENNPEPVSIPIPGTDATVALTEIDQINGLARVAVTPVTDSVVLDVSVKPFMSLIWLGAVITLLGGTIAMWRRAKEGDK